MKYKDMKNQKFGRLTALQRSPRTNPKGQAYWICRCDCGRLLVVRGDNLRRGNATQCSACFRRGRLSAFIEGSEENGVV